MKAAETSAAATLEGSAASIKEQELSSLQGLYWNRDGDKFLKTYLKDGKLRISFGIEDDYALKPVSETFFHIADTPWGDQANFRFEPSGVDKPRRLLQSFGDGKPDLFEPVPASTPSTAQLADYEGSYVSQEIEPIYRMVVQDGKLMLARLKHKASQLEPTIADVFRAEIGTIRFTRDSNRHVSGFVLNSGRIRNFHFTRRAN